jgi:hypothetical protein
MLQSCSSGDSSAKTNNDSGNVDYEFTIKIDDNVYAIKGNTINDNSSVRDLNNTGFAWWEAKTITFKITDPTYSNYVSGNSFYFRLDCAGNFKKGYNNVSYSGISYVTSTGNNSILLDITDLGTPSVGVIGSKDYKYGNTVKGNSSGTLYSKPPGSNNATVPHKYSIDFMVPRLY